MSAKYCTGEIKGKTLWHKVDEAGPDKPYYASFASEIHMNCFNKTLCGKHYGSLAVSEVTEAFSNCPNCK